MSPADFSLTKQVGRPCVHEDQTQKWFYRIESWVYIALLGAVEAISDLNSPIVGGWLHVLLFGWLLYRGSFLQDLDVGKIYVAFSILPLIRLVSLAVYPDVFSGVWFYIVTEGLVILFALFVAGRVDLGIRGMGLSLPVNVWTVPILLIVGMISGWIESNMNHHVSSLSSSLHWSDVWLPSLIILIFTGMVEEVIFRGILYSLLRRIYSPVSAVLITTIGWTSLHIGWHSWGDLVLVFITGLIWGCARAHTKSVIPVALSHGVTNIILFVVLPNH